jgi:hypothetical protein
MLGQSMLLLGTPLALGVSIFAFVRASDRPFAIAGLVLGGIEALLLIGLILLATQV